MEPRPFFEGPDDRTEMRERVVIVRLWVEGHPDAGIRARIIEVDTATAVERTSATAGRAGILDAVGAAIDRFVAGPAPGEEE